MMNDDEPDGGAAAISKRTHQSQSNSTTIATPASTGVRDYNNVKNNPIVTAEKSSSAQNNNYDAGGSVMCPDGSILKLSPDKQHGTTLIVFGPGEHGIPTTARYVPPHTCIIRLVKNATGKTYSIKLVVSRSACMVTRAGNSFVVSSSNMIIRDGDIIEPYHRKCSVEEATSKGTYHPFKVNVSSGGTTAALNPNAKWLYNRCSIAKSNMEYPNSTLHLATKILTEIRQHYSSKYGSEATEGEHSRTIQNLVFKLIDEGKKRDLQFVFDVTSKSHDLYKDEGLTVGALWDVAVFCGGDDNVDNDGLKVDMNTSTPTPHNDVAGQSIHDNNVTQQRRKTEQHTVMDGSAFLEASRKIDEAATCSRKASNEKAAGRVHFDDESFLETFLEDPTNTTNFFISYYKSVMKRVPSKDTIYNLLSTYVGAISPLGSETRRSPVNMEGVDDFPLKDILSIFIDSNQFLFGKRVIEGYIWLSCRHILLGKKKESNGVYSCDRAVAYGPKLLVTVYDPLLILCNTLGWDELEDLLVGSVEKLCECGNVRMALDFCQNITSKSSTLSGGGVLHKSRVCAKMFRMAYGKRFHNDPISATNEFIKYYKDIVQPKSSKETCHMLLGSFVDVINPPNPGNRRIPLANVTNYPLKELLSLLVEGECYALGKCVIDGYIWLSCQEITEPELFREDRTFGPCGPAQLITAGAPLLSICNALGWNELENVLIEAVKSICTHGDLKDALELCQIAKPPSDSSSGKDEQRSRVSSIMTDAAFKTIIARFHHNPTGIANFVISFTRKSADAKFNRALINDFVDVVSPVDHARRRVPLKSVTNLPLQEILSLLIEGKYFALGKRVIEGYIWLSCQEVRVMRRSYYGSLSNEEVIQPEGPMLLVSAFDPLLSLCRALGWNAFEEAFVESIQRIFQFGRPGSYSYMETAIDLIEKIHPSTRGDTDCSRVCVKMSTIACDEVFKGLEVITQQRSYLFRFYTKFIRLIANFCPAMAPRFETFAKKLDFEQMLYPLLNDGNFRSSASSSDVGKNILSRLTNHCVQLLHSRVSSDPDVVTAWTVPNAHACQSEKFRQFLQNQCKEKFDWQVRKSDHVRLQQELQALVDAGDITCKSYQPYRGGAYRFIITKLKTCRVHLNVLSCSCSSSSDFDEKKIAQHPKDCLRDSSKVKRAKDEEMLQSLKAYLTPEQIRGLSSQKRKAVDVLGANDDDDVVLTGVADVAETVAKRVKAAEDAGEVIEIL